MSESANIETPVIVGTAGHVDHGKSALVLALTGTDPDRLPQEKARGITIDLGFANLPLPDGRTVGLVDVPGHEHYVRAMVAGATGVDVALLVVAADDGVMPQTREHLRILELVGVRHMVVALTKCDLIDDPDWIELVRADIEEFLASTAFAGAPVVPVSARTGDGVADVAAALQDAVDDVLASGIVERRKGMPARLPVDRAFNIAGVGAVVTGTLRAGSLAPGDAVEVSPGGVHAKVRSVQVHGSNVESATAGQRTAVNLSGVGLDDVPRGCTVGVPGALEPHDRFDASLSWLGREGTSEPLVSGQRVHVCTGTSEVLGRILLFDGAAELACGESALVQIRLEEPLVVRAHDRFVVMSYSPVELVGGGEVLLARVARRTTPSQAERELLAAQLSGDLEGAVAAAIEASPLPLTAAQIAHTIDEPVQRVQAALGELVGACPDGTAGAGGERARTAVRLPLGQDGECYVAPAVLDGLISRVGEVLSAASRDPRHEGMPALTLRDQACPRADDAVFSVIVDVAVQRGVAGRFGSNVASADVIERMQARLDGLAAKVGRALAEKGVAAPFAEELAAELEMSPDDVQRGMRILVEKGEAERVDKNYCLSSSAIQRAKDLIRNAMGPSGSATASELRDVLGVSRKYALPLLEHFDRTGFTERDSADQNLRRIR